MFSMGRGVIFILTTHRPWGGAKCIDKKREKGGKETRAWCEGMGPRNMT